MRLVNTVKGAVPPVLAAIVLCATLGCRVGNEDTAVIKVFAAASLTDAFRDIASEFETENPGVEVKLNFAGSQRLRSQLELGAETDVFASADETQMTLAENAGLIAGNSRPFTSASMAVIVSSESKIHEWSGISVRGVKLVLAHESVPAGKYARRLLTRLSDADSGISADFAEMTLANVVSEETSVKFVEQKVVLGQADAGIVYRPGALTAVASGTARELPLPLEATGLRALYPIAVLRESRYPDLAGSFVEFVFSETGQGILAGYGFDAP